MEVSRNIPAPSRQGCFLHVLLSALVVYLLPKLLHHAPLFQSFTLGEFQPNQEELPTATLRREPTKKPWQENEPWREKRPQREKPPRHDAEKHRRSKPRVIGKFPWGASKKSPLNHSAFAEAENIATGSKGDVWKVQDKHRDKAVIIKIFFKDDHYITKAVMDKDEDLRRATKNRNAECWSTKVFAQSSYKPGRSHLCKCLESHVVDQVAEDDVSFLVLELCGGADLKTRLERQIKAPVERKIWRRKVRKWIFGFLKGLRALAALEVPVIHRDLKLENIAAEEEAVIIDFSASADYTRPMEYMIKNPPEVLVSLHKNKKFVYTKEKSWAYDVWCFGAIYRNLLCSNPWDYAQDLSKAVAQRLIHGKKVPKGMMPGRCESGGMGYGKAEDWRVIGHALALLEERKSPAALMAMMPDPNV